MQLSKETNHHGSDVTAVQDFDWTFLHIHQQEQQMD